ncbi:hypothetical protein CPB86DRAFT_779934, partial [Serendipita vermifera]
MGFYQHVVGLLLLLISSQWIDVAKGQLVVVDDTNSTLSYSPNLPVWKDCNVPDGGGNYVFYAGNTEAWSYHATWHEVYGDGAWVSLSFTGTRVVLVGTVAKSYYNTVVGMYIDDQLVSTYEHHPPSTPKAVSATDFTYLTTMADIGNLSPGRHTFKAQSSGSSTLFVLDSISYEPSEDLTPSTSSTSRSSSQTSTTTSSTSSSTSTTTSSNSTSLTSTTSTSSTATSSTISLEGQSIVASMDVVSSDSRITYSPVDAWKDYASRKRAPSCLEGTKTSSVSGSSFSFDFTGPLVQLYSVSESVGARYSISIDGQSVGTYDVQSTGTTGSDTCVPVSLYATANLTDSQHTVKLTVEGTSNTNQTEVIFAGIRLSTTNSGIGNTTSQTSKSNNTGVIVGGVLGGIALLALLAFLIFYILRRQRRNELDNQLSPTNMNMAASPVYVEPFNIDSALASSTTQLRPENGVVYEKGRPVQWPGSSMDHTGNGGSMENSDSQSESHEMARRVVPAGSRSITDTTRLEEPTPLEGTGDEMTERQTFYTLPSYNGQMLRQTEGRDLSEADLNAISRRLGEVMRTHQGG